MRPTTFLLAALVLACSRSPSPPAAAPVPAPAPLPAPAPAPASLPTTTDWRRLDSPAGLAVSTAGALGDRLYFAGTAADQRWLAFVGLDGRTVTRSYGPGVITAATPSGKGLVVGGIAGDAMMGKPWMAAIDADGTLRWQLELKVDVSGEIYAIIDTPAGPIAAGLHNPLESGVSNGWLVAVDPAGKLRWEKRPGTGSYHYLRGVAVSADGHVLALGAAKADTYQGWVVTTDASGENLRDSVRASATWDDLGPLAAAPGGGFYATGLSAKEQGTMRNEGQAVVEKVDATGTSVWRRAAGERVVHVGEPHVTPDGVEVLCARLTGDKEGELAVLHVPEGGGAETWIHLASDAVMLSYSSPAGYLLPGARILLLRPAAGGDGLEWRLR